MELGKLGVNADVTTSFDMVMDWPTWRLPHTVREDIPFYRYYGLDALHVFRAGIFPRVVATVVNCVKAAGDYAILCKNFNNITGEPFGDGKRKRETFAQHARARSPPRRARSALAQHARARSPPRRTLSGCSKVA